MKIDLKQKLYDIRGNVLKMSFPKDEAQKASDETVSNVLLNALVVFPIRDRKEIFRINRIAGMILGCEDSLELLDLSEADIEFLAEVVYESTYQQDKKGGERGIYQPVLTGQILEMLGKQEY